MLRKIKPLESEKINTLYEYNIIYSKEALPDDWFTGGVGRLYSGDISYNKSGYTHILIAWICEYKVDIDTTTLSDISFVDRPLLIPIPINNKTLIFGYSTLVFDASDYTALENNNNQNPKIFIHLKLDVSNRGHIEIFNHTKTFSPRSKFSYGLIICGLKKNFKAFYQNMVKLYNNIINNIRNLYYSPLSLI